MTAETLVRACRADPFEPFSLRLADGRSVPVRHPEFIAFNGHGRTAVIMDDADGAEWVNLLLVVSLDFEGAPAEE